MSIPVADPGFDSKGGGKLCQRWCLGGIIESVDSGNVIFFMFCYPFSVKIMF